VGNADFAKLREVDQRQALREQLAVDHALAEAGNHAEAHPAGEFVERGTDTPQIVRFDVLETVPQHHPVDRLARLLGPRGLMPNPKSGTVTTDVQKAVAEAKAGRVEYRVDSTGIVHIGVGKVSFGKTKLEENLRAVLTSVKNNKPASVKGTYLKSMYLTTTMGPSMVVANSEF